MALGSDTLSHLSVGCLIADDHPKTCANERISRLDSAGLASSSAQKEIFRPCNHSKYDMDLKVR